MKEKLRINEVEKNDVTVYDAIMGSGKTYDAINRMKQYLKEGKKFIYITPFKSEITRILDSLNSEKVLTPLSPEEKGAYQVNDNFLNKNGKIDLNTKPSFSYLNKRGQFLKMVVEEKNIISTHALFLKLKPEDYGMFSDYILILDEVVTPLQTYKIGAEDIQILKNEELIIIDEETNQVKFINDDYNDKAFKDVKTLCNNSTVYYLDKYFFVWAFPIEIFSGFKEVQILTYLFEGSLLAAYFRLHGINYDILRNESQELLNCYKYLLNIYDGKANNSNKLNTFSKTWIDNLSKRKAKKIAFITRNIFTRVFKTKSYENAYTTFKSYKSNLAGKGYTKGFIAINSRASNDYNHKKSLAYLGNRYFDPQTCSFFRERGVDLNQDIWALSELVQWLWRGCIRDKKEMNVFIPSYRMRKLLIDWLDGKYIQN